jgi:hypothetical protein
MSQTELTGVEDRFKATQDWQGRTYQRYSLEHQVNLAPVDDVGEICALQPYAKVLGF